MAFEARPYVVFVCHCTFILAEPLGGKASNAAITVGWLQSLLLFSPSHLKYLQSHFESVKLHCRLIIPKKLWRMLFCVHTIFE